MSTESKQIADAIHEYYRARDAHKRARMEILRIAVETGMDQQDAKDGSPINYLDGVLAGRGHLPEVRKGSSNGQV